MSSGDLALEVVRRALAKIRGAGADAGDVMLVESDALEARNLVGQLRIRALRFPCGECSLQEPPGASNDGTRVGSLVEFSSLSEAGFSRQAMCRWSTRRGFRETRADKRVFQRLPFENQRSRPCHPDVDARRRF